MCINNISWQKLIKIPNNEMNEWKNDLKSKKKWPKKFKILKKAKKQNTSFKIEYVVT